MKRLTLSLLVLSARLYSAEAPALDSNPMASEQLSFSDMIFNEIKEKADGGDIGSCLSYGSYLVGFVANPTEGREKYAEGVAYLIKAADAGQGDACLMVGIVYAEGHYGVQVDKEKAKKYFQRAVDKKVANAYARLAQQLVSDDLTCDQPNVVVDLLEKSIAAEDLAGYYYYAILLREADFIDSDLVRAFNYFKKASDEGDYSYADGMVAVMYHGGEGTVQNYLEAEKYYEKALEKEPEHFQYQLNLAQILFNNQGREPNLVRAEQLLTAAADSGSAEAQRVLGVRLYKGQRLAVNKDRGLEYLNKAAAQGDFMAATMITLFSMGM
ncbi:MAG: sel1 repeat family protein [Candidatus Paracaedibacteraceae bacterium]|nr:sel1 repeat family protein [Candidatus Paracaedibacteraceae bacterium]